MADYQSMVQRYVRFAFQKIGTLGDNAIFFKRTPQGFDFNSLQSTILDSSGKAIRVVKLEKSRQKLEIPSHVSVLYLLMITEDEPNISAYDRISFRGDTWNIVHPVSDDGYTTEITCTRPVL